MRLRHRLLVGLTVTALTVATIVASAAVSLIRGAVRERFVQRIRVETSLLAAWAGDPADRLDPQDFAVRAARRLGLRVTLIAADGTVIGDSAKDRAGLRSLENHAGRPEVVAARSRGYGENRRTSATNNVEYFYSARLVDGAGPVKYARIALPASEVDRIQLRYTWIMAGVVLGTMLLLSFIGYGAVRRLSRPIEKMTGAVERSARHAGELDLPGDEAEEIRRLGAAVTRMRHDLLEKIAELDAERGLLASVVSGMREGLLLVGSDRRIRLANDAARRIFELSFDPQGRVVEEAVRHPTVLRAVDLAFAGTHESGESIVRVAATGRAFELHVTLLRAPGARQPHAALLLMFEITRLEKLEGVRREFVANVSHELRTPLTSIKAFVETLADGGIHDDANARRFLQIIRKHAERMNDLIDDLTDLSLIETGAVALDVREVDAREVAREVREQVHPSAVEREVKIRLDLPSPFPVSADRRRLEEILTNLVDNAVKFSHPGGEVRIRGRATGAGPVVAVEDDGIGIPSESLDKVFHRFYQVNRDRSREVGGTGLGLSIVKHLMRLHGGRVRVESELGRGSAFILEFPSSPAPPAVRTG